METRVRDCGLVAIFPTGNHLTVRFLNIDHTLKLISTGYYFYLILEGGGPLAHQNTSDVNPLPKLLSALRIC